MADGPPARPKVRKVVALTNSKSGERAAFQFLHKQLQRHYGEANVVNLIPSREDQSAGPGAATMMMKNADLHEDDVVIVAGGDGTVAWGMDLVESAHSQRPSAPYVGIIPMGTGNDLSRSLGFGPGFTKSTGCSGCCSRSGIEDIVAEISNGYNAALDRWKVTVSDLKGDPLLDHKGNPFKLGAQEVMNNYLSVGFDAWIAQRFDTFRRDHPVLCKTRACNKMWYAMFGTAAMCGSPVLDSAVTLRCRPVDDTRPWAEIKDLPEVVTKLPKGSKTIILTNIDSFAAGMNPWKPSKKKRWREQRSDDQLFEVCVFFGSSHMGFAQVGCRSSAKVAQTSELELEIGPRKKDDPLRMQIDGEPLTIPHTGCRIKVTWYRRTKILTTIKEKRSKPELLKATRPLDPCEASARLDAFLDALVSATLDARRFFETPAERARRGSVAPAMMVDETNSSLGPEREVVEIAPLAQTQIVSGKSSWDGVPTDAGRRRSMSPKNAPYGSRGSVELSRVASAPDA